jgi:hypothetical protein
MTCMKLERQDRQIEALAWCQRMCGSDAARVIARAHAVAAEAIALAQAEGLGRSELHVLIERAGTDPIGEACDLVGSLSIALLAFCEARGLSADHCERNELARLLSPISQPLSDKKEESIQNRAATSIA